MAKKSDWNKQVLESIVKGTPKPKAPTRTKSVSGVLETHIQQACIKWFMYQYNMLWQDGVLFHIPNEGIRQGVTGKRMKSEGIVRGVADLCLAVGRHGYHALYVEMKRPGNYQSDFQKAWEKGVTKHGNLYAVIKSFEDFKTLIDWYLS